MDTTNKDNKDDHDNINNNKNNNDTEKEIPKRSPPTIIPMDIEEALSSAKLYIQNNNSTSTTNINSATAYYLDASGRAPLTLKIHLKCENEKDTMILHQSGLFSCLKDDTHPDVNFVLECQPSNHHSNLRYTGSQNCIGCGGGKEHHTISTTASISCLNTVPTATDYETQLLHQQPNISTSNSTNTTNNNNNNRNGNVSVEYVSIKSSKVIYKKENNSKEQADYFELEVEIMTHVVSDTNSKENTTVTELCAVDDVTTTSDDGTSNTPISQTHTSSSDNECRPMKTNLEIRAVVERRIVLHPPKQASQRQRQSNNTLYALEVLELGGGIISPLQQMSQQPAFSNAEQYGIRSTASHPIILTVHLVQALSISVQEIGGARAASGATLVSLTISHSNQHMEPVTVSNIALHPGHSTLFGPTVDGRGVVSNGRKMPAGASLNDPLLMPNAVRNRNRSMQGGESSVIDMSHYCSWGYAQGTAPRLPLILNPHEAISTVLQIDAWEEHHGCRTFLSPISVTSHCCHSKEQFILSTYCKWTTARIAFSEQPVDAFRIDMSLLESQFQVGVPFVVFLQVLNLSQDDRDLMLLMAKDEEGKTTPTSYSVLPSTTTTTTTTTATHNTTAAVPTSTATASTPQDMHSTLATSNTTRRVPARPVTTTNINPSTTNTPSTTISTPNATTQQQQQQQQHHSVNTAVVSEVNGYTFGVWGLAGEDDGTIRHNRDHELLAVDAALLLGEVKGQHTIQAELRFVPLREGTLDVPNLKLYDKLGGRWYDCVHMLKIVASAN